jgi:DNA-binding MarR family transcriptional regulator
MLNIIGSIMNKIKSAPEPRERLAHSSWLSVVRCYHLCDALLAQRVAVLGVKLAEHELLVNLLLENQLTQQQLAERCFSARSGISMLISRLEAQGWVERQADPVDRRVRRIALTAAGEALARTCFEQQREVVALMTAGADDAALRAVREAMQTASGALQQALSAAPPAA